MTIFESWHADKAFHQRLELSLLTGLGRVLAVVLSFYLSLRLVDLLRRHVIHLLFQPRSETYLFWLEALLLLIPMVLLFRRSVHTDRTLLYLCSVLTLLGFVANRMNVAITGMLAATGSNYFPKWTEISITLAIIASGFLAFALAAKYLPIFPNGKAYATVPSTEKISAPSATTVPELSNVGP
jgi:Ni/Fe-hydrogenase subunit HybB-like protein